MYKIGKNELKSPIFEPIFEKNESPHPNSAMEFQKQN
jgi:hypothetical protein